MRKMTMTFLLLAAVLLFAASGVVGDAGVQYRAEGPQLSEAGPVLLAQTIKKRSSDQSKSSSMEKVDPRDARIRELEEEISRLKSENARLKAVIYEIRSTVNKVK